jgi:hypothetical protein
MYASEGEMIIAEIDIREKPAGEEVETAFWNLFPSA